MTAKWAYVAGAVLTVGLLASPGPLRAQTFGYFGDIGPAHWGELSPEWTTCGTGETQSPVDLGRIHPHFRHWHKLSLDYRRSTGEIFNNGHTIEVEVEGNNKLTLDGVAYELVQFHFHTRASIG
jgi:carbonic anhydrase